MSLSKAKILRQKIKALGQDFENWTPSQEREWESLNSQYDVEHAREVLAMNGDEPNGNNPMLGRNLPGDLERGPNNPQAFGRGQDPDEAVALASWIRNAHGEPIPANDFQRATAFGTDPRSGAYNIALPTGSPTMGLQFNPMNAAGTLPGTSGGFTVPSMLLTRLESAMKAFGPMLQTSEVWVTSDGRETGWPTIDDTSNTSSRVGENADAGTATDLTFGSTVFRAFKESTGILKASHAILRDSAINMSNAIVDKLGERIGRRVNTLVTTGSVDVSGLMMTVPAGTTAASTGAITMDELILLQHSVDPAYRAMPGVGFMMNDTTASAVRRLKDGDGNYLWQNAVQQGQPSMLLGYPVFINQDMASMSASSKPIVFGHLPSYKLRIVNALRMRTLVERYAEFDQTGFIGFLEFDGHLLKPSSTDSLCPIQALAMSA